MDFRIGAEMMMRKGTRDMIIKVRCLTRIVADQ